MEHPTPTGRPVREIAGCSASHAALVAALTGLTDTQAAAPSRLPDWTVGHVLAHLARNADSHVRMLEAAAVGLVAEQYPGGLTARAAEIEADAHRPAAVLVDDVRTSNAALEAAWAALPDEAWSGEGLSILGPVPMNDLPFRRWRETEVHHIDLGLARTHADWPAEYVRLDLARLTMQWASRRPMGLTELPAAALAVDDRTRLAWLLGRAAIDGLDPAGIF